MKPRVSMSRCIVLALVVAGCAGGCGGDDAPSFGDGRLEVQNDSAGVFTLIVRGGMTAAGPAAGASATYDLHRGEYAVTLQQNGGPRLWTGYITIGVGYWTTLTAADDPTNPQGYAVKTKDSTTYYPEPLGRTMTSCAD